MTGRPRRVAGGSWLRAPHRLWWDGYLSDVVVQRLRDLRHRPAGPACRPETDSAGRSHASPGCSERTAQKRRAHRDRRVVCRSRHEAAALNGRRDDTPAPSRRGRQAHTPPEARLTGRRVYATERPAGHPPRRDMQDRAHTRAVRFVTGESCVGHGTHRPASTVCGTTRGPVPARSRRLTDTRNCQRVRNPLRRAGRGATTRRTARPSRAAASCGDNRAAGPTRPCLSRVGRRVGPSA